MIRTLLPVRLSGHRGVPRRTAVALTLSAALVIAACGSDDEPAASDESTATDAPSETDAPADTEAPAETAAPPETDAPADTEAPADDGATGDAAFPVEIEHKFGTTTIESEPQRVVSIGFNQHDFLLALDVVPVGLRDWYGEQPNSVWPWAQDELGDAAPEVIPSAELSFEQIAALEPDMINALWSGITEQDYELLSAIAPTVAEPADYQDYGTPWQEQTEILGLATGRSEEAAQVVADVEALVDDARDSNPEWAELDAAVAFVTEDGPGVYSTEDIRSRFLADLGFNIPAEYDEGGDFFLELSAEDLSAIDVDLLVWVAGSQEGLDAIVERLATRPTLGVVQEGREIFASIELGGAFSHSSPLSIEFVVEQLIPEIELAVDGDPTTVVPSAVEVGAVEGDVAESDDGGESAAGGEFEGEAAAAAEAWATVFDSAVPFADKAPFMADADALAGTVEAYAETGSSFGGISLVPTAATVDGDTATITYDVNFGENPAYGDVTGTISLVDGVWTVSRDEFCSFMASARVGCDA